MALSAASKVGMCRKLVRRGLVVGAVGAVGADGVNMLDSVRLRPLIRVTLLSVGLHKVKEFNFMGAAAGGGHTLLLASGNSEFGRFIAAGLVIGQSDGTLELTLVRRCVPTDDFRTAWKLKQLKASVLSAMEADPVVCQAPWLAL